MRHLVFICLFGCYNNLMGNKYVGKNREEEIEGFFLQKYELPVAENTFYIVDIAGIFAKLQTFLKYFCSTLM